MVSENADMPQNQVGSMTVKRGLAQMLKGGVIMDVVTADHARIAEEAGAVAVMALERVPADIRAHGGVARMSDPGLIREIMKSSINPGHGQVPNRSFCRGPDFGSDRCGLYR
jgi:pyridoxal 5'-phosphate synthase pdxS subunit